MHRLLVLHPREGDVVVAPAAADRDGDLVVGGAIEGPVVEGGDLLDDVNRVRLTFGFEIDQAHDDPRLECEGLVQRNRTDTCAEGASDPNGAHGESSSRNSVYSRRVSGQPQFVVDEVIRSQTNARREAPRLTELYDRLFRASPRARRCFFFSASFSVRACDAISLTTSNSSRLTRSRSATMRSIWRAPDGLGLALDALRDARRVAHQPRHLVEHAIGGLGHGRGPYAEGVTLSVYYGIGRGAPQEPAPHQARAADLRHSTGDSDPSAGRHFVMMLSHWLPVSGTTI